MSKKSGNLFGKGLLEVNNVLMTLLDVIALAEDEFDLLNSR